MWLTLLKSTPKNWLKAIPFVLFVLSVSLNYYYHNRNKYLSNELNVARQISFDVTEKYKELLQRVSKEQEESSKVRRELEKQISELNEQLKLVNDERFDSLFQKKHGLLIRNINRATERVFNDIQASASSTIAPDLLSTDAK